MKIVYTLLKLPVDAAREMIAAESPLAGQPINPEAAYVALGNFSFRKTPGYFGAAMCEIRHVTPSERMEFVDRAININSNIVPSHRDWRPVATSLPDNLDLVLVMETRKASGHATVSQ